VARFVSCDLWNDKHALVSKAIVIILQKAWGIRNAYKHGTSVDDFESASERRGADGIDARAWMATYIYIYILWWYYIDTVMILLIQCCACVYLDSLGDYLYYLYIWLLLD
jgi:hypothetical protein